MADDQSPPRLLKHQLQLEEIKEPDGSIHYEISPLSEPLDFDKGFYAFVKAIQLLKSVRSRPVIVGLAGPSGAGKTVFSDKINDFMPGCAVLSMDMYNRGDLVVDGNFDDPRLTDYDLLLENLRDLQGERPIASPIYDFRTSTRTGYRTVEVPPAKVVIVEGIYALNSKLRDALDLRVSIRGGVHFDLMKRVVRDVKRSGQEPEAIINQISETVFPMYKAFIEPDLKSAQLQIINHFNPFQGFQDPTFILKSEKEVSEAEILTVFPNERDVSVEEADLDDIYLLPPGEDPKSCQSWLRMRNRDGRYTLMFEEYVLDGPFLVSPRIKFEVSVRILGGLMALGYDMWCVMRRRSKLFTDGRLQIKRVDISGMGRTFVQIQGNTRSAVADAGNKLGLEDSYLSRSYIELAQEEGLLEARFAVSAELKERYVGPTGSPLPQTPEQPAASAVWVANSDRQSSGARTPGGSDDAREQRLVDEGGASTPFPNVEEHEEEMLARQAERNNHLAAQMETHLGSVMGGRWPPTPTEAFFLIPFGMSLVASASAVAAFTAASSRPG